MSTPNHHTVTTADMSLFISNHEVQMASGPTRRGDRSRKKLTYMGGMFYVYDTQLGSLQTHFSSNDLDAAVQSYNNI